VVINAILFQAFIYTAVTNHRRLSGVQFGLQSYKSYYQLIIKITISEKRRIAKLGKKGKIGITAVINHTRSSAQKRLDKT